MSKQTEKICTGCGRSSLNPVSEQHLACCPDSNYIEMSNNKQSSVDKEFVPYEQALALKELGFNEPCLASYLYAGKRLDIAVEYVRQGEYTVLAPIYQQAFRWFREKYKLGAIISQFGWGIENELGQIVNNISDSENPLCYEEAEILCLKKLIKIQGGNK